MKKLFSVSVETHVGQPEGKGFGGMPDDIFGKKYATMSFVETARGDFQLTRTLEDNRGVNSYHLYVPKKSLFILKKMIDEAIAHIKVNS